MKLDIGAGNNPEPDCIAFDVLDYDEVDVVGDGKSLPFQDDTFDTVYAHQTLEHLDPADDVHDLLLEVDRVLQPGGLFEFSVPVGDHWHSDPTHKWEWNESTIDYHLDLDNVDEVPPAFPRYFEEYPSLEVLSIESKMWLESERAILKPLSFGIGIASSYVGDLSSLPFVSGVLLFRLQSNI